MRGCRASVRSVGGSLVMSGLRCICLAWILVIAASCASIPERPLEPAESAEMQALEAFARVYGYVRWFYPGDEAAKVDWDRFAVEGARRMLLVHEASDLGPALEALFAPVAFNLRLYTEGGQRPVTPLPAETSGLKVVAWQHYGARAGSDRLVLQEPAPESRRSPGGSRSGQRQPGPRCSAVSRHADQAARRVAHGTEGGWRR